MSEDNKPIEAEAKAPVDESIKNEERATGEMPVVATPTEADAPPVPEASAAPVEAVEPAVVVAKVEEPTPEPPKAKAPDPVRTSRETITMPVAADVGAPPAVPGDVEDPTELPAPEDVPTAGSPTDPAKAPGRVPSGDSRSLRRAGEFALIYRRGTAVITRFGTVGQRGQWRVVEYPTPSSASNAYAKECSRFVGEGFSDYRD